MIRRTAAALVAGALVLAACGGGDDESADDREPSASTVADDATGDSDDPVVDAGDGSDHGGADDPTVDDGEGTDAGSCTVQVEGDVTAEWTSPGGYDALNMGYWLGEDNPLAEDAMYWIVNCIGPGTSALNLLAVDDVTEADIPFGPKTLTVRAGLEGDGELTQLLVLDGDDAVWELESPGVVDVTDFDDEHIAGTFELRYRDQLADVTGDPERHITVTGSFDYANPNF